MKKKIKPQQILLTSRIETKKLPEPTGNTTKTKNPNRKK